MVARRAALQHITSIHEQMKAVGDLFRLGSAGSRARRVVTGAIAR